MSSTAIATQILRERNLLNTKGGSSAFSILLFQDIAVLPVLALLPYLAGKSEEKAGAAPWVILLVIAGVVLAGQILLRHILRIVAGAHLREVFTAMSLLLVVGMAALMEHLGVSMALGAFVAGVLLATSEYRHAIEMDIEPFKGILLGLFFMTVGMTVDLTTIAQNPTIVAGLVLGLVVIKLAVHMALARAFKISFKERPLFSILISQVGEFAFVLFASARALDMLTQDQTAILSASVAISMASTALLLLIYDRGLAPRLAEMSTKTPEGAEVQDDHPEVLIAGFGRVGQIVGRLLYANGVTATVLDHDPDQIEMLRRFGFKVYYGDATRLDLLEAAGAARAKVLVVAVDDREDSLEIVDLARQHFPHLQLVVRARNVGHVYDLIDREITVWERETFESSLRMSTEVLKSLGWEPYSAVRASNKFRDHNVQMIYDMHSIRNDEAKLTSSARQARMDLENMFKGEREALKRNRDGFDVQS
jgi:glutathione-regulated potassium-efflux system ancillary protein KefC